MRLTAAVITFGLTLPAFASPDCRHSSPRAVSTSSAGISKVSVIAKAGSLAIRGQRGASEVRASGTACTQSESLLRETNLSARRSGSELIIEALVPDNNKILSWSSEPSLSFTVTVPDNVPIDVHDKSGSTLVENVASLSVEDGSGDLTIRGVGGSVSITDGSGAIHVSQVGGLVHVTEDGSGEITIEKAASVLIDEDGSGSIGVSQVRGNVTIGSDGSGSIDVEDVSGDLVVKKDGSGGVHHSRVAGRIAVPQKR